MQKTEPSCGWCGKTTAADKVRIVVGPVTGICEECVRLCCDVLGFPVADAPPPEPEAPPTPRSGSSP